MFVELEELHLGDNDRLEWRETARWIKYEEDVLEETDRWGKPHVSTLSFRSLLELRQCIEFGLVKLDMTEVGLSAICSALVSDMVESGQIPEELSDAVLQALLLRHVHQCDPHTCPVEPSAHITETLERNQTESVTELLQAGYDQPRPSTQHSPEMSRHQTRSTPTPTSHALRDSLPQRSFARSRTTSTDTGGGIPEISLLPLDSLLPHLEGPATPRHSFAHVDSSTPLAEEAASSSKTVLSPDHSFRGGSLASGSLNPIRKGTPGHVSLHGDERRQSRIKSDLERLQSVASSDPENPGIVAEGEPLEDEEAITALPREERELLKHLHPDSEGTTVLVGSLDFLESPIAAFVRLAERQQLKHVTEVPVPARFFFILIGPPRDGSETSSHSAYHEVGRSIATLMADDAFQRCAAMAKDSSDLLSAMDSFLDKVCVVPPGKWDSRSEKKMLLSAFQAAGATLISNVSSYGPPSAGNHFKLIDDPLARTGKFFGGMLCDLQRLRKRYVSDILDARSRQVFFTALFMYFAALAPVITFGGLLGNKTVGQIGLSEMLISTSLGGMIFSLLTGQPLMLIGPTGPLLVFEEVIYEFCAKHSIPFLPFRFWTGVWICVSLFVVVATDASLLAKKFTRFTKEVFAALIGSIFMYEALKSIHKSFQRNPLTSDFCQLDVCQQRVNWSAEQNASQCMSSGAQKLQDRPQNQPNAALVYFILVFGTFTLAYSLRVLRHSRYLSKEIRRTVSDFGILITIISAVLVAHFVFGSVATEKIAAASFATTSNRSWVVDPLGGNLNVGYIFAAIIPGLLVAFLIFIKTQVTALIVASPDHRLVKGQSFHWNLAIVSVLVLLCSVFGLPWLGGAPVPSLSHTSSLLLYRKDCAPGERPVVSGAVEQRVSNFLIHSLLLITVATPLAWLMQQVPVAVLFGVFFYLGLVSVLNLQLVHRIVLLFVPPKHHPDFATYVREVRTRSMHLYTGIQLGCLLALSAAKLTPAALGFPLIILLMVPLRNNVVTRFFSKRELKALDPQDSEVDTGSIEDEYDVTPLPS